MAIIDIAHLEHIKEDILAGIKAETKEEILSKYSISDQLNASGATATTIRTAIKAILASSHAKAASVVAAVSFEELEVVVPQKEETI